MLAIEVVFAGTDQVPTLVFDEVDAGVGGKAAVEVGRRLARLARTCQVLVVTHLPQVAAFADRHVVVEKSDDGRITTSGLRVLDDDARVRELASHARRARGVASRPPPTPRSCSTLAATRSARSARDLRLSRTRKEGAHDRDLRARRPHRRGIGRRRADRRHVLGHPRSRPPAHRLRRDGQRRAGRAGAWLAPRARGRPGRGRADRLAAAVIRERLGARLALHEVGEHLRDINVLGSPLQNVRDVFVLMATTTDDDWAHDRHAARGGARGARAAWSAFAVGIERGMLPARRQVLGAARHGGGLRRART